MERNNTSHTNWLKIPEKLKNSRFYKFFDKKLDWKAEKKVAMALKLLMYVLIVLTQVLIFIGFVSAKKNMVGQNSFSGRLIALFVASVALSLCDAIRLFWARRPVVKIVCFILEMIASVTMISITGSSTLIFLYILILTGFYIGSRKPVNTLIVFVLSIPIYILSYWLTMSIWLDGVEIAYELVISESVWALVALVGHFFFVNFALGFYRQYLRLDNALSELAKSRNELQKAYDSLAEATVLEERQRIAKEIHDTAGHSITTVIMQTEAARLVIDKNPEDAKLKLVAANLQAKSALEELRESVHVLSGNTIKGTLQNEMQKIIEESMLGTGITIRCEIGDVTVAAAKDRFLCNTLKECISNGIRHGKATAFWVELKEEDGEVVLLVSDNGCGLDMVELRKGFGLSSMAESAERFGGRVEIVSEPDEGMEIVVRLPV